MYHKQIIIISSLIAFGFLQIRNQLGDVNDDSIINILDIVRTVNIILENNPPPTEYELWAADVNVDSEINVQDIIIIIDVLLENLCPELFTSPCEYDLSQCCSDTTSHNFVWEIDTLGINGFVGSRLMDVSIIDENNIWAVGEIIISDDIQERCNVAHWDGSTWQLLRVTAPPYNVYSDQDCIFTFAHDNIWIGVTEPLHWDGSNWETFHSTYPHGMGWMNAIWGSSPSDIYFIHDQGNVVFYNGEDFTSTPTGTTIRLRDIAGSPYSEKVFIVGWDDSGENIALEGNNEGWSEIYYNENYNPTDSTYGRLSSVDVIADTAYFSTVAGLWKYNYITEQSILIPASDINFDDKRYIDIAHNSSNDIMFLSAWYTFNHFNGSTWELDEFVLDMFGEWSVYGRAIDMMDDFVVAVGKDYNTGYAVIARGYRR